MNEAEEIVRRLKTNTASRHCREAVPPCPRCAAGARAGADFGVDVDYGAATLDAQMRTRARTRTTKKWEMPASGVVRRPLAAAVRAATVRPCWQTMSSGAVAAAVGVGVGVDCRKTTKTTRHDADAAGAARDDDGSWNYRDRRNHRPRDSGAAESTTKKKMMMMLRGERTTMPGGHCCDFQSFAWTTMRRMRATKMRSPIATVRSLSPSIH